MRDPEGRGSIFSANPNLSNPTSSLHLCFDRRNSQGFDTDGVILGHLYSSGHKIRMLYVGFRRGGVKFSAFSGLAESKDQGNSFVFVRRIATDLSKLPVDREASIVACHWADLNDQGDGLAFIVIGNGWVEINGSPYPKYSTYAVWLRGYEIESLISKMPQESSTYRLGRPRVMLEDKNIKLLVATGGKLNGDYRPYFFTFDGTRFQSLSDLEFPVNPGDFPFCKKQVSYPHLTFSDDHFTFFANGDHMGINGMIKIRSIERIKPYQLNFTVV
jgi:hypothetical protein